MAKHVEDIPLRKIPESMFILAKEALLHPFSTSVMKYSPERGKLEVVERYKGKLRPEHEGLGLRAVPILLREAITHPFSSFFLVKDPQTGKITVERPQKPQP